ncbi:DUF4192 family protein [Demequina sp.]|uniref:DUF4192 family protein n=1 Tax=Demequina sp. TaxID=2050685 RepID=UPI003A86F15A
MTTHVMRSPGELISALPAIMGRVPHEEVVVAVLGADGCLATVLSLDRAVLLMADLDGGPAQALAAHATAVRGAHAVVVSYTTADVALGCDAADVLAGALDARGIVPHVWACDGRRYWSPGCADARCCPPGGTALPTGFSAEALEGVRVRRGAVGVCAKVEAAQRRAASRAGDRWWQRRERGLEAWRHQSLALLIRSRKSDSALDMGKAAVALRDIRVRDALIVTWLGAPRQVVRDVLEGRSTAQVENVMSGALRGGVDTTAPPAWDALEHMAQWAARVASHARKRDCAALHALEALVHWWGGDEERAAAVCTTALTCDDQYSLARLIASMCEVGVLPGWMRP